MEQRKESRSTQTPQIKDPVPPKPRDIPIPQPRDQQGQGQRTTDPLNDLADKLPPAVN